MKNQVDAIRGISRRRRNVAHVLNSSLNKSEVKQVKEDITKLELQNYLYVAPESLNQRRKCRVFKISDRQFRLCCN